MKRAWLDVLRCPVCRGEFHLDATREAGDELVEAFLVCRECLRTWPLVGGSGVLPAQLAEHWRSQGSVYRRTRVGDPRVTRFVLAGLGSGVDLVPFEEVTAHYGDLVAESALARPRDAADEALERAFLTRSGGSVAGRVLDLGCGVGRSTFTLAGLGADALGADRSASRVRRARNLAATAEAFYVPAPDDPRREVPLELEGLARERVDFVVADPERLPLRDAGFDGVVDHGGDGLGAWPRPDAVAREARRVLKPGGWLVEPGGRRIAPA